MDGPTFRDGMAVLYLLGAAQGLFLAAVLASRHRNTLPNRLLAAFVLVFSVDLAMAVYHASAVSTRLPALIGLDLPIALLYGPLLYLYVRTLTAERPALRRADWGHAVPFVLLVLFLVPFYLRPGAEKLALMEDPTLSFQTRAMGVVGPIKLVHGVAYLGLVVWRLRWHRRRVEGAPTQHVTLRWLRTLTVGVVVLLAASAVLYAVGARGLVPVLGMDPTGVYDDLTLLGVTAFVYALGYLGLRQPEIFAPAGPEAAPASETTPYARSGMRPEEAARHYDRLVELMETERPYRRGDLTLADLADLLGVSSHNLTEVLNTQAGQSFYDVVNGYRVREVQARLTDPAYAHWTVLAIGMEAGFNAKSSFNAAFKRHAGVSPSQYRQRASEAV